MNIYDNKWQFRFMDMALQVASWSKDPKCQVGALVVSPDGRQVAWGYNGFPRGIKDDLHVLADSQWKNALTIHAEVNALANCATSPVGWVMFSSRFPCHECAKMMIQEGLGGLVAPGWHQEDRKSKWSDSQELAEQLLHGAGIQMNLLDLNDALVG